MKKWSCDEIHQWASWRKSTEKPKNILRENHGLPRIGEGWVSETQMYELINNLISLMLNSILHLMVETSTFR